VSASVNLPSHLKVQKFSSGTGSPGWSREKGRKTVVVVVVWVSAVCWVFAIFIFSVMGVQTKTAGIKAAASSPFGVSWCIKT